ncbi:hypothetical protein ON010_g16935 [Phytophthora cinnamomi]|nr:hypothetical protein ON010_g16935 [Phytophthora cinnamomi]
MWSPKKRMGPLKGHTKPLWALAGSGMAGTWWPEALMYMTAMANRVSADRLKCKTRYEVLYGKKPKGLALRIWGSKCYAHVPKTKRANKKISDRATECKLLGMSDNYKRYRLLDIKGNRYLTARDVRFDVTSTASLITRSFPPANIEVSEDTLNEICGLGKRVRTAGTHAPEKQRRTTGSSPVALLSTGTVGDQAEHEVISSIPRPRRKCKPNSRPKHCVVAINTVTRSIKVIPVPRSLKEALRGPHAKQWGAALQVEYRALISNGTWELVKLPKGRK